MTRPVATRTGEYDEAFFDKVAGEGLSSARVVFPIVLDLVRPGSVIDVGCGPGSWLAVAMESGIDDVLGIDGAHFETDSLRIPRERFREAGLIGEWPVDRRFDLALCLEVAEHLPPAFAGELVFRLTRLSPAVLFSAAIPGQEGTSHVNEQWPEYWQALFGRHGFVRLDPVRRRVWQDPRVAWYYQQNLYLFVDSARVDASPALRAERDAAGSSPLTLLHPKAIRQATSASAAFRRFLSLSAAAVRRRLWR